MLLDIVSFADTFGWQVQNLDYSPITGPEGNIEFLAHITPRVSLENLWTEERIGKLVDAAHENMKKH